MNTSQLHLALSHWDTDTRKYFVGVFAEDQLPRLKISKPKFCLVFNTQPSVLPGMHWISIYVCRDIHGSYIIEYFDSLGGPPRTANVINFLKKYSSTWIYNPNRFQGDSKVCGQYCIMFLALKCRNEPFYSILRRFSQDRRLNDRIVFDYVCTRPTYKFLC